MKREQVLPHVMADMAARIAKGSDQYGEPLTTNNGRDSLQDAYEEVIDLALYLKQALMERDAAKPFNFDAVLSPKDREFWRKAEEQRLVSETWPGPDWSRAPVGTVGWICEHDGSARWIFGAGKFTGKGEWRTEHGFRASCAAPSFFYPGPWRDSLRKRPA